MGHWINQTGNKKYLETNENGNTVIQNLCSTTKAVWRGKFLYQEQKKKNSNKPPNFTPKELEKQEQAKSNVIRKKERKNEDLSGNIWNRLLQK